MALTVTHQKVLAGIPDEATNEVHPTDWNANHVVTGSIDASNLPTPTTTTLGGIKALTAVTHQWLVSIDLTGTPQLSQPAFTDISGSLAAGQFGPLTGDISTSGYAATLVNIKNDVPMAGDLLATNIASPATPALGKTRIYVDSTTKLLSAINDAGTKAITVVPSSASTHQFCNGLSTGGAMAFAQPAFSDLSGNIAVSQMNSGTGASSSTFWRGDGTWATTASGVGWYNVNNYASIAAAYTACAATGGILYFPFGTYTNGGSTLTVSANNVTIMGDGPNATVLSFPIVITGNFSGVQNAKINGVTGNGLTISTTTTAVLANVQINSCTIGIQVNANASGFATNLFIYNCGTYGIELNGAIDFTVTNFTIQNCGKDLYIHNTAQGNEFVNGELLTSATNNLYIDTSNFNLFVGCFFDSDNQGCIHNSGNNNWFDGCWFSGGRSGGGFAGMAVTGNGTQFTGCKFYNNGYHGLLVNAASTFTTISGCSFNGNSTQAGAGVAHGCAIAAGTNHFTISNCQATNGTGGGTQGWGIIVLSGTSDYYNIANNNVQGNATGGVSDGGSGTHKSVTANN